MVVLAVGCGKAKPTGTDPVKGDGPNPAGVPATPLVPVPGMFPPEDWTHKQLVEHLGKRGVKVRVEAIPLLSQSTRIAARLYDDADNKILVMTFLCAGWKDARDQAGAMGTGAFSKGRFAFGDGDAALLKKIEAALAPQ